jgi:hypothetical protein
MDRPEERLRVRALLWLTTRSWRGDGSLASWTAARLADLRRDGWRIREAEARDFVIWRTWLARNPAARIVVAPGFGPRLPVSALVDGDLDSRGVPAGPTPQGWSDAGERDAYALEGERAVESLMARIEIGPP